eukprot:9957930-Ditylum_brightwellii.AAC.1
MSIISGIVNASCKAFQNIDKAFLAMLRLLNYFQIEFKKAKATKSSSSQQGYATQKCNAFPVTQDDCFATAIEDDYTVDMDDDDDISLTQHPAMEKSPTVTMESALHSVNNSSHKA